MSKTTTLPTCSQMTTQHNIQPPDILVKSLLTLRYYYKQYNNFDMGYIRFYTLICLTDLFNKHGCIYREQTNLFLRGMGFNDTNWYYFITEGYLVLDRIEKGKKYFKPTQKLYELMNKLNSIVK